VMRIRATNRFRYKNSLFVFCCCCCCKYV
jgi:hypothetical protein